MLIELQVLAGAATSRDQLQTTDSFMQPKKSFDPNEMIVTGVSVNQPVAYVRGAD